MSILGVILILFAAAQFYWLWRGLVLLRRRVARPHTRAIVGGAVLAYGLLLLAYNFGYLGRYETAVHLTLRDALLTAPFAWWAASSIVGFIVVLLLLPARGVAWLVRRRSPPESASRRHFLERTVSVAAAAPFVAGAYGMLYGRLNLETTATRIRLARLPRAFEGFRIAQLSDIHIGPFMPQEEIRRYVAIANALKVDMIVLTGDFVTFDPSTERAVVEALSGLRAPYGVFGCLGNHDTWTGVEESITALFQQAGIRILRQERVAIRSRGDELNLIGTDFQTERRFGPTLPVRQALENIEGLVAADRVNLLLSHNPATFPRAAGLGIDLSLAGHTHGGQAALEFISPELAPTRLVTPYVAGLFEEPGGQLYVNRGIGTVFVPIRIGAPPEISVFQLTRG
jgi:predicted MPP superfamily phosphohydrolase